MHVWAIYLPKYHWSLCKFHYEFKWLKLPNLMMVMSLSRIVRALPVVEIFSWSCRNKNWKHFDVDVDIYFVILMKSCGQWTDVYWWLWFYVWKRHKYTCKRVSFGQMVTFITAKCHDGCHVCAELKRIQHIFFSANFGKIRFVLSTRNFLQNDLSELDSNSITTFAYCFYDVKIEVCYVKVSTRPNYQIFLLVFRIEDTSWHTTLSGSSPALAIHAMRLLFFLLQLLNFGPANWIFELQWNTHAHANARIQRRKHKSDLWDATTWRRSSVNHSLEKKTSNWNCVSFEYISTQRAIDTFIVHREALKVGSNS